MKRSPFLVFNEAILREFEGGDVASPLPKARQSNRDQAILPLRMKGSYWRLLQTET